MKIDIFNLINFEKVDVLLEGFNKSTGFVTAILDLEGNVLSKSGWRQMCTHFHRINPETSKMCTISDTVLAGKMAEGEKYHFYKCLNGLVDVAVPIIINNEHIANLFSGQFFFERPDRTFFKKQAEKYGFDEKKYLEAFDKVPVVSKEEVKTAMDFLLNMTQLISDLAFQKLEQMELNLTIRANEERQRMILQTAMDGFWMVDLNGKFIEVNDVACKMAGYTRKEMLKLGISDLEVIETAEQSQKHIQKILEIGEDRFESKHRCKNNEIIDVELSVKFQSHQNVIVVFVRNITKRKQAEEDLKKSEETYRLLFDSINDAVMISEIVENSKSSKFLIVNKIACERLGYTEEELLSKSPLEINSEESKQKLSKLIPEFIKKGYVTLEAEHVTKDGRIIPVEISTSVGKYDDKTVFYSIARDITERKQAEEKLQSSEVKFRTVAELSPIAIYASTGSDQKGIYINEAFYKIFGFTLKDVPTVGVWWIKAFPDEKYRQQIIDQWAYNIEQADKNNTDVEVLECVCVCKDGSEKNIAWVGKTIDDEFWAFGYDLTERKQSEDNLMKSKLNLQEMLEGSNRSRLSLLSVLEDQRRAQQEINKLNAELEQRVIERTLQLELANKELESFSYSVSHDLRSPLRGIDGFSLALFEDYHEKLDDSAKNYIDRIRMATKKMDGLIERLLKLSRISRLEMNLEEINLSTIVLEITKELKENEKTRSAKFIIQKDITIFADSNLMKIALENLVNNAWKFTSKKDSTIIEFGAFEENSKTAYFVKDNGIGFDMKYADKLFSAFQRLHSEKEFPGTGVGLTTVQRIIRRHNGTIWVDSKLNEGTTFYFSL
jgi:PAS domain S-box-containing protein